MAEIKIKGDDKNMCFYEILITCFDSKLKILLLKGVEEALTKYFNYEKSKL